MADDADARVIPPCNAVPEADGPRRTEAGALDHNGRLPGQHGPYFAVAPLAPRSLMSKQMISTGVRRNSRPREITGMHQSSRPLALRGPVFRRSCTFSSRPFST